MGHPLVPQLIEMLRAMQEIDFAETAGFKFMASLRNKLIEAGFSTQTAEALVSSMEIDVPPDSLDDEEVEQLSTLYADLLVRLCKALTDNGFRDATPALTKMAENFSLKLS